MSINTIPDHIIEDIELRLLGADHRPWALTGPEGTDSEGRRFVIKGSRRQLKKAVQEASRVGTRIMRERGEIVDAEGAPYLSDEILRSSLALFYRSGNATDEMLDFVVHAPEDIEGLLREVKQLRIMATKYKEERDAAVNELQSYKVAASRAEQKITDMRRAWRTLIKEMGVKL